MNQIVTIVKIAGKSSRILLRTFEHWSSLRTLGPEGRNLLEPQQWQPQVRNEMDAVAASIVAAAAQPPIVFHNQRADLWSSGYQFSEAFEEVAPPVGNEFHQVLGDEFELLCYPLPDGGALDKTLQRRLRRRTVDDEARWYWRVLREAISSWQLLVEESVLVVVRRVAGGLVTDEELEQSLLMTPDWINSLDPPARDGKQIGSYNCIWVSQWSRRLVGDDDMSQVNHILYGVIRGRTIELTEDAGLPDGQQVAVVVHVEPAAEPARQSAAGMLANYPEMDEYLEEILRERKLSTIRELGE